jgi:hypothetical protein
MPSSISALRGLCYAGGAVATAAGLHSMLTGAGSVPGGQAARAPVDSELRYYGAFYAAFGLALLRTAPRAEREPAAIRALAATVFAGGIARARGLSFGRPHPAQLGLLTAELTAPPALLVLQARAAAGAAGG